MLQARDVQIFGHLEQLFPKAWTAAVHATAAAATHADTCTEPTLCPDGPNVETTRLGETSPARFLGSRARSLEAPVDLTECDPECDPDTAPDWETEADEQNVALLSPTTSQPVHCSSSEAGWQRAAERSLH